MAARAKHPSIDYGARIQSLWQQADGLAKFRYSVIIENSREEGYRSEKLLDAIICKTIPIYFGAPDIGDEFDRRGVIICSNLKELCEAIERADEAGYEMCREFIEENHRRVSTHPDPEKYAAALLLNSVLSKA